MNTEPTMRNLTTTQNYGHRLSLKQVFLRYAAMLQKAGIVPESRNDFSAENAYWLCNEGLQYFLTLPIDKLNRWMGFIQCVVCMHKLTTVQAERDFTRPIFTNYPVY